MSNINVEEVVGESETEAPRVTDEDSVTRLSMKLDKHMKEYNDLGLSFQRKEETDNIFKFFIVIFSAILFALLFWKCMDLANGNQQVKKELEKFVQEQQGQTVFNSHTSSCMNLENENNKVKQQMAKLIQVQKEQAVLNSHTFSCPAELTMIDFKQHKSDHDNWRSLPFYTHPEGYKICLKVYANGVGIGNGSYISVFISIMQGEFDDELKWPFQGNFTISILDQEDINRPNTQRTVHFTDIVPVNISGRAVEEEANRGWGFEKFFPHADLHTNNDCLKFHVDLKRDN